MTAEIPEALRLPNRDGPLPPDVRFLIEKYPRPVWSGHANYGEMTRFWISRHDMFRELGEMLTGATRQFREEGLDPLDFRQFLGPRLRFMLSSLEGHHQIEDLHYFPRFRRLDPRLEAGFDLLENDHEVIHAQLLEVAASGRNLLEALSGTGDPRRAVETYATDAERLIAWLMRHLGDEEDLFVPVVLDRGEAAVGLD